MVALLNLKCKGPRRIIGKKLVTENTEENIHIEVTRPSLFAHLTPKGKVGCFP